MEQDGVEEQVSLSVHDYETMSSDSEFESFHEKFENFTKNGMVRLHEDGGHDSEYSMIRKSFMVAMAFSEREINVVGIHKNSYSNLNGQAKLEAFRIFSKAVAEKRGGDANIKYAWYSGGRDEILKVIAHGFGGRNNFENGVDDLGVGIILTPANVPSDSALRAVEDENGARHMLLCRVILGNTESICTGSRQFQPTSTDFDSGVDSLLAPRKYIVWRAHMNSHIFPNYIVSFKTSTLPDPSKKGTPSVANLPRMKMPKLLNELAKVLKPSNMGIILHYYNFFQEKKIDRPQFIQRLRSLVGDKLLINVIKLCRDER